MTSSLRHFDRLWRFHSGIEAGISWLKRCFCLKRYRWRGLSRLQALVHATIFAHILVRIARPRPEQSFKKAGNRTARYWSLPPED